MPSIGVIRGEEGPYSGYTLPQPATKRVLVRLSRGLEAFPASSMPRAQGGPSSARVAEVVPAATRTTSGEDGDGSAWKLSLLAILPLGLLVGLRRRRKS
jgi:MYXO-CTERM domain-containing protein